MALVYGSVTWLSADYQNCEGSHLHAFVWREKLGLLIFIAVLSYTTVVHQVFKTS